MSGNAAGLLARLFFERFPEPPAFAVFYGLVLHAV
jgi:hypothetical protein